MPQDTLQRAKECYADTKEAWRENHHRMREDLLFGDRAEPQQWDDEALKARRGRVCLTLDRTEQYRAQVINEARKNKPAMTAMPVDSRGDVLVARQLDGMLRHIEYRSRAQIAYDWAVQGAADCGIGWIRIVPEVIDPATNQQDICIKRVIDHLSIVIDGTEPDGSDARHGFAETLISRKRFEAEFPGAAASSWEATDGSWITEQDVLVLEHQYVEETKRNMIVVAMPNGDEMTLGEDEYWDEAKRIGYRPQVVRKFEATERVVKWCKFNRDELLEETTYPGRWIGMVPVIGYESYVNGKRRLCGITRRMMQSQRAYNYERSAGIEAVAMQPKAPVMTPHEAVEGHEEHWQKLGNGNPAYLPYNHIDGNGNPIPKPDRLAPPQYPAAFAQGGQMAIADMEGAIGMNRANLGQPGNATSGRQERERKEQGATATYHFPDNQARSIEHVGRIVVGQIPVIYDTKRQAKILGMDGQQGAVMIDPSMQQAVAKRGKRVIAINPTVGQYDVRVKPGPSYTTQREEAVEGIKASLGASPAAAGVLLPAMMKMQDWPDADRYARMLIAMLPPEVQAIANEGQGDDEEEIPPQVQAKLRQMQGHMQQMAQMLDAGEQHVQKLEADAQRLQAENQQLKADRGLETARLAAEMEADEANEDTARYRAETERLKVAGALMPTQTLEVDEQKPGQEAQPQPGGDLAAIVQALMQRQSQLEALLAQLVQQPQGDMQEPAPGQFAQQPA